MKNAYIYARVSTEEQAQNGQSIETQLKICKNWGKDNDYSVVGTYIDEGKSATNLNRQALKDLLLDIQNKENLIEAILVQDTDRLARNTLDHLTVKSILKDNGVKLISISQPMLDNSPEGNLIDTIIASVNAFQSEITGRKTSKVMEEKAKLGWLPSSAPIGYLNSENPKPESKLDERIITLDKQSAPHIKEAFKMYALGSYSMEYITDYLNSKNVMPKRGVSVHRNTVSVILKNDFYAGVLRWGGKVYKGSHEPLVTEPIFNKVQAVIKAHNHNASRQRKHSFLLKGFLVTENGNKMFGEQHLKKSGRLFRYYYAKNEPDSYENTDLLEEQVELLFQKIQISKKYVEYVLAKAQELLKDFKKNETKERSQIQKQVSELDKAIDELEDARFVKRDIDNETFLKLNDKYSKQKIDLEKQLKNLNTDHTQKIKELEEILRLAENIGLAYKEADFDQKRNYLNMFFKSMVISEGKITDYTLTDRVKVLVEEGSVQIVHNWGG